MTPDEIRIAVAECCGWKICSVNNPMGEPITGPIGLPPSTPESVEIWNYFAPLPNYPASLDACYRAEALLKSEGASTWLKYWEALVKVCEPSKENWRATPLQRCEAFLRVKGKWKEATP